MSKSFVVSEKKGIRERSKGCTLNYIRLVLPTEVMTAIIVSKTHYLKCSSVITPGQVALVWAGSHFPRRLCRLCILIRPCTSLQGLCLGTDQQKCPWNIEDKSITQWPINTSYSISFKIPLISNNQMEKRWFAILFFLLHNSMHISYNSAANYLFDTNKKKTK